MQAHSMKQCPDGCVISLLPHSGHACPADVDPGGPLSLASLVWCQSISATAAPESQLSTPTAVSGSGLRGIGLRVLCIGDSITVGIGDGNAVGLNNGYRLDLYNSLNNSGIAAQFIGTQISGSDNPQPRMEGYGWQTIYSILNHIQLNGILSQQANLVLIHAGTNDNDLPQNTDNPAIFYANAPERLGNLLDYVLDQTPTAVVLVAKLIQNKYNQTQTDDFNSQVSEIVGERYSAGHKVQVVDMSMIGGDELSDALHPTAAGYADMADRWYRSIMAVPDNWWSVPLNMTPPANTTTLPSPQSVIADPSQTASISLQGTPTMSTSPTHVSSALRAQILSPALAFTPLTLLLCASFQLP